MTEKAKHFDAGKPDLSQLPYAALSEIAQVFMYGATKYGRANYERGFESWKLLASALRHIYRYLAGEDVDDESKLSHLAHAAANLIMLMHTIALGTNVDTRPVRNGVIGAPVPPATTTTLVPGTYEVDEKGGVYLISELKGNK